MVCSLALFICISFSELEILGHQCFVHLLNCCQTFVFCVVSHLQIASSMLYVREEEYMIVTV